MLEGCYCAQSGRVALEPVLMMGVTLRTMSEQMSQTASALGAGKKVEKKG